MKLKAKPWNDPWNRSAERTRSYKVYSWGHHDAGSMSWRRLKKMAMKFEGYIWGRLGRRERAITAVHNPRGV